MFTPASQTLLNDLINNVCICCLVVEMVNKGRGWKSKFTPIKINFFNSHNFTNFVFNYMLFDRHLGRGKIVNYTRRRCEKIFSDFKTPFTTFFYSNLSALKNSSFFVKISLFFCFLLLL